jgi:hypothetical protein
VAVVSVAAPVESVSAPEVDSGVRQALASSEPARRSAERALVREGMVVLGDS